MTRDELVAILGGGGYQIKTEERLPNGTGYQIRLATGQMVNLFDKGTWNVQGKNPDPIKKLLADSSSRATTQTANSRSRDVFVAYGHDSDARTQLEAMLRRWDLNPLFLDQ